jgi:phage terminase small subunit
MQQERFCQFVANGMPAARAYKQAGYAIKSKDDAAAAASRLLSRNASVRVRIKELKEQFAQSCEMTREDLRNYLIEVLATPVGEITPSHRLCQAHKTTADMSEVKLPDKLRAAEQLAKMMGWNEPDKHDVSGGIEIVVRIGGDHERVA